MKILLTNSTREKKHLGCQATSYALETLLLERFAPSELEFEPLGVRHGDWPLYLGQWGRAMRARQMQDAPGFARYREADLIVVNGEGSLYGKPWRRAKEASNHRLLETLLAKTILDKRVFLVNHSVAPGSGGPGFEAWLRQVYEPLDHVAVREPLSLQFLQSLGISRAVQAADAIFSLDPPPACDGPLAGKVLLTDSSSWNRDPSPDVRDKVRGVIAHLRRQGCDVAYWSLFPDARQADLARELDVEHHHFTDWREAMAHLSGASFVLAGRFHAAVFCALCGVPFLGLEANTWKIRGLCQLLEHPHEPVDFGREPLPQLLESIERALSQKDTLGESLRGRQVEMKRLARRNVPE